jgi:RluA family pseudouridine synthase
VSGPRRVRLEVTAADAGLRLDQYLAARVDGLSRRKARVLLDIGGVFVDRARVKMAGRKVRAGQVVEAHLGGALERATGEVGRRARERDAAALPPHRVVYQDDELVVVDKPAGLLTAPTPESDRGNLADVLARALGPIFVVHRIDLFTSGLLVFARTEAANRALSARFRVHDVVREYQAVLVGDLVEPVTVDLPIDGRRAVTHFAVDQRIAGRVTLARARLETGRTHQIRIHARHLGRPVAGDGRYGARGVLPPELAPPRMALHAARLAFPRPGGGEPLDLTAPLPDDLTAWLASLRHNLEAPP